LWFLSKNRQGGSGYRKRLGEVLFIDGRELGTLIPGSRKQKELSADELERIAGVYSFFKRKGKPEPVPGFAAAADVEDIRAHNYTLTPGRYVGSALDDEEDGEFADRFPKLMKAVKHSLAAADLARRDLDDALARLGNV
jgi:type I restriction enzyme M protein